VQENFNGADLFCGAFEADLSSMSATTRPQEIFSNKWHEIM
jgi:hypothetical protein